MNLLGVHEGDVVKLVGTRPTVAKCLPLFSQDSDKEFIRTDAIVRNNAGVALKGNVIISRVTVSNATRVTVSPEEAIPPIDEKLSRRHLGINPRSEGRHCDGTLLWRKTHFQDQAS